jgi:hypothetical protein
MMSRHLACCVLVASGLAVLLAYAPAAPAPSSPWADGWKTYPAKGCRFDRRFGLTITLPAKGCYSEEAAPRLVRCVKGDFTAEVRVCGSFRPAVVPGKLAAVVGAGLLVDDGKMRRTLERHAWTRDTGDATHIVIWDASMWLGAAKSGVGEAAVGHVPVWLRLRRRDGRLLASYRTAGKPWVTLKSFYDRKLPPTLTVGVFAEACLPRTPFKPTLDHFRLTK